MIVSLRFRVSIHQVVGPNIVIGCTLFGRLRQITLHLPNLTSILESGVFIRSREINTKRIEIILTKILILIGGITLTVTQPTINNTIRHKSGDSNKPKPVKQRALHGVRLYKRTNIATNAIADIQMTMMGGIS